MTRFNLVGGNVVEDEDGLYVLYTDFTSVLAVVEAQVNAANAYIDAVSQHLNNIKQ
jgi:hypothetical protein